MTGCGIELSPSLLNQVLRYYEERYPAARVCVHNAKLNINDNRPNFIRSNTRAHKHMLPHGRYIVPSNDIYSAPNSIIQSRFGGQTFVGQITEILSHEQLNVNDLAIFVCVRWFKPLPDNVFGMGIWDILYVLCQLLYRFLR